MITKMISKTDEVLARLRRNRDGGSFVDEDGTEWAQVYLDNAIPQGMSRHAFAGHLSALQKRGLYKPQGDAASVTSSSPDAPPWAWRQKARRSADKGGEHMGKHAPGPWRLHLVDDTTIIDTNGRFIASVFGGDDDLGDVDYNNPDEWPILEANARLIAAAPDLLKALKVAQLWLDVDGRFDMQGINAAIAKAEGRS